MEDDNARKSGGYMGKYIQQKRWKEQEQLRSLSPETRSRSRGRSRERTVTFHPEASVSRSRSHQDQTASEKQYGERRSSSRSLSRDQRRQQQSNLKAVLDRDPDQLPPSAKAEQTRLQFWHLVQEAEKVTKSLGPSPPSLKKMNKNLASVMDVMSTLRAMEKGKKWASRSLDGRDAPKKEPSVGRSKSQRLSRSELSTEFQQRPPAPKSWLSRDESAAPSTAPPFSAKASNIPMVLSSQNTNWEIKSLDASPSKRTRQTLDQGLNSVDVVPSFVVSPTKSVMSQGGSRSHRRHQRRKSKERASEQRRSTMKSRGQTLVAYLKSNSVAVTGGKLSVVGKYLKGIGKLPAKYGDEVLTLFLSNNNLEHLERIEQFPNVETLSLANNLLSKMEELAPLDQLGPLRNLNVEGNPVTRIPNFTYQVLYRFPQLEHLNKQAVEDQLREEAPSVVEAQCMMEDQLFIQAMQLLAYDFLVFQIPVLADLRKLFIGDGQHLIPWFAPFMKNPGGALEWLLKVWINKDLCEAEGSNFIRDKLDEEAARRFARAADACRTEGKKVPTDPRGLNRIWTFVFEELLREQAMALGPLQEQCSQLLIPQIEEFAAIEMRLQQARSPGHRKSRRTQQQRPQGLGEIPAEGENLPPPKRTFSPDQPAQAAAQPGVRSRDDAQTRYQKLLRKHMPSPSLRQAPQGLQTPQLTRMNSGTSGGSLTAMLPPQQAEPDDSLSPRRNHHTGIRSSADLAADLTRTLLEESLAEYEPPPGTFGSLLPSFKVQDPQAVKALNSSIQERLAELKLPSFDLPAIPDPPDLAPPRPFVKAPPGDTLKHLQRQAYGLVKDLENIEPVLKEVFTANSKLRKIFETFKRGRERNIMRMQETSGIGIKILNDLCEDIKRLAQMALDAEHFFGAVEPLQVDLQMAREELANLEAKVHERRGDLKGTQEWQDHTLEDLISIEQRLKGAQSLCLEPVMRIWVAEAERDRKAEAHHFSSRLCLQRAFSGLSRRVWVQRRAKLWARRRFLNFVRKVFWAWSDIPQLRKAVASRVERTRTRKALYAWMIAQDMVLRIADFHKAWTARKAKRMFWSWKERHRENQQLLLLLATSNELRFQRRMFRIWHAKAAKSRKAWIQKFVEADFFFLRQMLRKWNMATIDSSQMHLSIVHTLKLRRVERIFQSWRQTRMAVALGKQCLKRGCFSTWCEAIHWNRLLALSAAHYLSNLGGKVLFTWRAISIERIRGRRMFLSLRLLTFRLAFDHWRDISHQLGDNIQALEFYFTHLLVRTLRAWHQLARSKVLVVRGVVALWAYWRKGVLKLGWRRWARFTWRKRCELAVQGRRDRACLHLVQAQKIGAGTCFQRWQSWVCKQKQTAKSYTTVVDYIHKARITRCLSVWLKRWSLRTLSVLLPGKTPFNAVRESLTKLQSTKSGLRAAVAKLEEDQQNFTAKLKSLQANLTQQEVSLQEVTGQHKSALDKNRKLERHLAAVQSQVESTEALIGNVHARIRSLKVGPPEDTASEERSLAGEGQPGGRTSKQVGRLSKSIAELRQRQNRSSTLLKKAQDDLKLGQMQTNQKLEEAVKLGRQYKQLVLDKQDKLNKLGELCTQQKQEIEAYSGKLELYKQDRNFKKTASFDHLQELEKKVAAFRRDIASAEQEEQQHVDALSAVTQEINELEVQRKEELHKLQMMERVYPELTPQEGPLAVQSAARRRTSRKNLPPRPVQRDDRNALYSATALELASHRAGANATLLDARTNAKSVAARKTASQELPSEMSAARAVEAASLQGRQEVLEDLHRLRSDHERSAPIQSDISEALNFEKDELARIERRSLGHAVRDSVAAIQTPEASLNTSSESLPLKKYSDSSRPNVYLNESSMDNSQFSGAGDLSNLQSSIMELEKKILSRLGTSLEDGQGGEVSVSEDYPPESARPLSLYGSGKGSDFFTETDHDQRPRDFDTQSWGISSMSPSYEDSSYRKFDDADSSNSVTQQLLGKEYKS